MKINQFPLPNSIAALFLLALPVAVHAQFTWVTNSDRVSITIKRYTGTNDVAVIPDTINGYPVTGIGVQAFYLNTSLTSVTMPGSVTSIGAGAFLGCHSLASINILNSVTNIGGDAFQNCGLTSVTIHGNIGEEAFENCASLTNVTIANGFSSFGFSAFYGCTALTSARFEGNAPSNDGAAFSGDSKAVVYYLPGTIGWGTNFGSAPTQLWFQPQPTILSFEPSFGIQNQQFGFTISWATNASVILQACTNLSVPVWIPVATNALSSGTNYFTDPQWTNFPSRFYRVSGP